MGIQNSWINPGSLKKKFKKLDNLTEFVNKEFSEFSWVYAILCMCKYNKDSLFN